MTGETSAGKAFTGQRHREFIYSSCPVSDFFSGPAGMLERIAGWGI
jgi:hypothetical protein